MGWLNPVAGFLRVAAWFLLAAFAVVWVRVFLEWPLPRERVGSIALFTGLLAALAGVLYWLGKWIGSLEAVRSEPLARNEKRVLELALFAVWFVAAWHFGWLDAMVEGAREGWNRPLPEWLEG